MKLYQTFIISLLIQCISNAYAVDTIVFSEVSVVKPDARIEFVINTDKEISTFHKTETTVRNKTGEVIFSHEDDLLYIKKGIIQFPAQFAEGVKRFHQIGVAQEIKRGQQYMVFRSANGEFEYSVSILIK